jgi:hypothetical protein
MLPTELHLVQWVDPAIEPKVDADPGGRRPLWLPLLGPPAASLLNYLQALLKSDPGGLSIDLDVLSQLLGLGKFESKHAPVARAIARLVHFGLAKRTARGQLAVRARLGVPSPQQLEGLSLEMQIFCRDLLSLERAGAPGLPANGPSPREGRTGG